ncbi:LysR family transcriptional regulator [Pseudomonas sp. BIOMIG1BAC]|nr:LysR family transcriptional regulator [Pseudomonas sp. BIOMIG1BAC]
MVLRIKTHYAPLNCAARFSSFTQAAENLFIIQSAVSRHVKTLEEHFGYALFDREGPKISRTHARRLLGRR